MDYATKVEEVEASNLAQDVTSGRSSKRKASEELDSPTNAKRAKTSESLSTDTINTDTGVTLIPFPEKVCLVPSIVGDHVVD